MERKGFLLLEVMGALCILAITITSIALYHAQIQLLCGMAKKRHEALNVTHAVIETLQSTKQLIRHTCVAGVTVTVTPIMHATHIAHDDTVPVTFYDLHTVWRLPSGADASFDSITCIPTAGVSC